MAVTAVSLPSRRFRASSRWSPEMTWGTILILPYLVVFLVFVLWPVAYGFWLGSSPASYRTLFSDPIYLQTVWNTVVFLGISMDTQDVPGALDVGLLRGGATVGALAERDLHPAMGGAFDPDDLLVPLDVELGMGHVQYPAVGPVQIEGRGGWSGRSLAFAR